MHRFKGFLGRRRFTIGKGPRTTRHSQIESQDMKVRQIGKGIPNPGELLCGYPVAHTLWQNSGWAFRGGNSKTNPTNEVSLYPLDDLIVRSPTLKGFEFLSIYIISFQGLVSGGWMSNNSYLPVMHVNELAKKERIFEGLKEWRWEMNSDLCPRSHPQCERNML